jgi:hypothetical protein
MNFPDDVREAGLLFEEYGYKINAMPVRFGKFTNHVFSYDGYLKNFPATNLNNDCSIILNHYLSGTASIDVDDYRIIKILLHDVGIDIDDLIENTMAWRGGDNHCKLIYKKHDNISLNRTSLKIKKDNESILTFKGYQLPVPVDHGNLNNYFDHLPPSWYIPNPKIKYDRRYQFITRLFKYEELPVIPDSIIEIWSNFSRYEQRFIDLAIRE